MSEKSAPQPETTDGQTQPTRRRRPLWRRILKWTGITIGTMVALFVIVCSLIVWILTPGRLTPLVTRTASEYLDADVSAARIELTFWHTFPRMTVDVDSLTIDSRALDSIPDSLRQRLPDDYRRLLSVGGFHGGINVMPLLKGDISLYDVVFRRLAVNLVQVNDSLANYDIVPPSEEPEDEEPLSIPSISINRFEIADAAPLRYRSLADSTDFTASLRNITLDGSDGPRYALDLNGVLEARVLEEFNFSRLIFGANGKIVWESARPLAIALQDFMLTLDKFHARVDLAADLTDTPQVESFRAEFPDIPLTELLSHVPATLRDYTDPLKTDMRVSSTVSLARPWNMADTLMPSLHATVDIPPCTVTYEGYTFRDFTVSAEAAFDGSDIDASWVDLRKFHAEGESVDADLSARVTDIMSDPMVDGRFKGRVNLGKLPPRLKSMIPVTLTGILGGDADFRLRQSDLTRDGFHRMYAKGRITLDNLHADAQGMMTAYTRHALLEFGTSSRLTTAAGARIDSLLSVSLKIDTLAANGMGLDVEMRDFAAGVGTVNRAQSADTTEINPFGGRITIGRLKFDAPDDTLRARLADASVSASLRRFKGGARSPLMHLDISARRIMAGQALTKFALTKAQAELTVHLNEERAARRAARREAAKNGAAPQPRRQRTGTDSTATAPNGSDLDLRLDTKERRLLRNWDYSGHVKAARGRLVTPYLPLRNRLSDIDLRFNQDSVTIHNTRLASGQSDFTINGTISNLRRALTARRNNTLKIEFSMASDTINVNELVHAIFAGPALAHAADSASVWADNDDLQQQELASMADTAATEPLLLPRNLDARLHVGARNILYSDMVMHGFRGDLLMADGALNLRNLSASTDIGAIDINGLYSGADRDSLQFGLGMRVNNFMLDKLTTLVPAIDSIMPAMKNLAGVVNADVAVTTDLLPDMDLDIPTLQAAIKIEGKDLVLLDPETFKTVSKWLIFKDKSKNVIDSMTVEAVVENSAIEVYPFIFNIDRYRLGIMGHNDMDMNMNYHVSVLKSPIPFKFGINIKGTPEKMKIRLGGAKVKPGMVGERQTIAANTRVNLVREIDNVFRRGIQNARRGRLKFPSPTALPTVEELGAELEDEHLSHADSLQMIRAGLIENPDTLLYPMTDPVAAPAPALNDKAHGKKKKR